MSDEALRAALTALCDRWEQRNRYPDHAWVYTSEVRALLAAAPAPTEGDPYCICGGGADHDDDCPRADEAGEGVSGLRERDLRARLAAVTALHGHGGYFSDCRTCRGVRWPCPTVLAAAPAPTEPAGLDGTLDPSMLRPEVCTDPNCTIRRRPGRPMHGPHDFRAAPAPTEAGDE